MFVTQELKVCLAGADPFFFLLKDVHLKLPRKDISQPWKLPKETTNNACHAGNHRANWLGKPSASAPRRSSMTWGRRGLERTLGSPLILFLLCSQILLLRWLRFQNDFPKTKSSISNSVSDKEQKGPRLIKEGWGTREEGKPSKEECRPRHLS